MNASHRKLLAEVKRRQAANFSFRSFGGGLSVASQYMRGWFDCIDSSQCDYLKNINLSRAMKHASNTLTWCEEKALPTDMTRSASFDASATLNQLNIPNGTEIPQGALMVFRNVVTTNDEDRDGDVLHTRGARIDTPMPLLWQHNSALPIGKMLAVDQHNDRHLRVFSVLLDLNDLTEDTAKLIEAGAMRISHGFIPLDFRERVEDSKDVPWNGFDIHKFEIMEESVVSVPSNRGAVIDLYSRDAFKSAPMQCIGKTLFDKRPDKVWPGFDLSKERAEYTIQMTISESVRGRERSKELSGTLGQIRKALGKLGLTKGGRELSKANLQLLRDVVEDLKELMDSEGLSRSHAALINKNISALESLIDKNTEAPVELETGKGSQPEDPIEGDKPLLAGDTEDPTKRKPPQPGDDDEMEDDDHEDDDELESKSLQIAIRFITFNADTDQLKLLEETLAARKEIDESYQVGSEYRELVNNS
jgi:hypothetical protein